MEYALITKSGKILVEFDALGTVGARNRVINLYRNRNISCCENELTGLRSLVGYKLVRRADSVSTIIDEYC